MAKIKLMLCNGEGNQIQGAKAKEHVLKVGNETIDEIEAAFEESSSVLVLADQTVTEAEQQILNTTNTLMQQLICLSNLVKIFKHSSVSK